MTGNAGERLFDAIGQIPDEMVLEAARQQPDMEEDTGTRITQAAAQQQEAADGKQPRKKISAAKLSGYLKYLPAAACLCIVLGGVWYVVNHTQFKKPESFYTSGSSAGDGADGVQEDMAMDDAAAAEGGDGTAESTQQSGSDMDGAGNNTGNGADGGSSSVQKPQLPLRYDGYEGPVFPLTATGDTQKLKVSRSMKGSITTEGEGEKAQPQLHVEDVYKIKNTAKQDKTLQLVYPFVTTLNRAPDLDGGILTVEGEAQTAVTYSVGGSIRAYRDIDAPERASMEDYQQIFSGQAQYQEQALAKEADWDKEVRVYTFSDIRTEEGADAGNQPGVIGVTVKGGKADVLTYGFDHSFETEDGSSNHCFFLPQEQKKLMLIVAGEQEAEPEPGYYTNLDCEEQMDGIQCEMNMEEMSYADALRLCSNEAARKLRQDYEQGMYDAELPEYMNEDAAFAALTMAGEEDTFYDMLVQRYQSTELTEIFERLFGETRVVYAMTTVTIPAKQSVQATVQTKKRQKAGNGMPYDVDSADDGVRYDFFSGTLSRLQIDKTALRLKFTGQWQLVEQNMDLEQKQERVWKGDLREQDAYFIVDDAG